jgi:hypothetical protein
MNVEIGAEAAHKGDFRCSVRHVHVLQVLGAQLQSLCEKRSFVAQLKTDLQKPRILMTAENLLALIL